MKNEKQTIERHGDKFIITDEEEQKIEKSINLEKIMLADGKSFIPCSPGFASGTTKTTIKEEGDKIILKKITSMKLSSAAFLRLATSIRAMRDFTKQSKEAYDYFKDKTDEFEPFVKDASAINKKMMMQIAKKDKKNNEKTR